ncbi:hypothetical protein [Novosphingobium barchaimii]|uniref:hypothetical protein n=1 Tax=Novosphingobium barchaimii TaxID=1420591 RepID=UPI0011E03212|nr:hypothetical protein [Novosphingobium barchaimii]
MIELSPKAKIRLGTFLAVSVTSLFMVEMLGLTFGAMMAGFLFLLAVVFRFTTAAKIIQDYYSSNSFINHIFAQVNQKKLARYIFIASAIMGTSTILAYKTNESREEKARELLMRNAQMERDAAAKKQAYDNSEYGKFMNSCIGLVVATTQGSSAGEICENKASMMGLSSGN